MELNKLKIDKYKNISVKNFPKKHNFGIQTKNSKIELVIYFINKLDDVDKFYQYSISLNLPLDNRTIMDYEKGRKDRVNRDSNFLPFKDGKFPQFKLKAPMLCSISNELSACVLSKMQAF